jgi:hypothetical protein
MFNDHPYEEIGIFDNTGSFRDSAIIDDWYREQELM